MKNGVAIREFNFPADYAEVFQIWSDAGPGLRIGRSDSLDEIAKKIQRDPDLFLVAELDGKIIGAVLGGFDGRRGMVYHLAVAEDYRDQGIGASLMKTLEDRLRAKGCLKAYLLVLKDNAAMRFYEEHGWKHMDLYIYGKELV